MQHGLQLVNEHALYSSDIQHGDGSYLMVLPASSAIPSSHGLTSQSITLELPLGPGSTTAGHDAYFDSSTLSYNHLVRTSPTSGPDTPGQLPAWHGTQPALTMYAEAAAQEPSTIMQLASKHAVHVPAAVPQHLLEPRQQAVSYATTSGMPTEWYQSQAQSFQTPQTVYVDNGPVGQAGVTYQQQSGTWVQTMPQQQVITVTPQQLQQLQQQGQQQAQLQQAQQAQQAQLHQQQAQQQHQLQQQQLHQYMALQAAQQPQQPQHMQHMQHMHVSNPGSAVTLHTVTAPAPALSPPSHRSRSEHHGSQGWHQGSPQGQPTASSSTHHSSSGTGGGLQYLELPGGMQIELPQAQQQGATQVLVLPPQQNMHAQQHSTSSSGCNYQRPVQYIIIQQAGGPQQPGQPTVLQLPAMPSDQQVVVTTIPAESHGHKAGPGGNARCMHHTRMQPPPPPPPRQQHGASPPPPPPPRRPAPPKPPPPPGRVFVGQLSPAVDEDELRAMFASCGEIMAAKVLYNGKSMRRARSQWRSREFGFVDFVDPEEAKHAVTAFDGRVVANFSKGDLPLVVQLGGEENRPGRGGMMARATSGSLAGLSIAGSTDAGSTDGAAELSGDGSDGQ